MLLLTIFIVHFSLMCLCSGCLGSVGTVYCCYRSTYMHYYLNGNCNALIYYVPCQDFALMTFCQEWFCLLYLLIFMKQCRNVMLLYWIRIMSNCYPEWG